MEPSTQDTELSQLFILLKQMKAGSCLALALSEIHFSFLGCSRPWESRGLHGVPHSLVVWVAIGGGISLHLDITIALGVGPAGPTFGQSPTDMAHACCLASL